MKIETKYNIGDEVWATLFDEPTKCTIGFIEIAITRTERAEWYYVVPDGSEYGYNASIDEVFPTKEELLKSL